MFKRTFSNVTAQLSFYRNPYPCLDRLASIFVSFFQNSIHNNAPPNHMVLYENSVDSEEVSCTVLAQMKCHSLDPDLGPKATVLDSTKSRATIGPPEKRYYHGVSLAG